MRANAVYTSVSARKAILAAYEEAIGLCPLAVEGLSIGTEAGQTGVLAFGPRDSAAPPLVLLHGSGSNSSTWLGMAQFFGAENRTYAIDIPGDPGFSAENRLPLDDDSYPRWLEEVLAALESREGWKDRKPILIGLSLGAWLALGFGIYAPDSIGGLILLSPSGLVPPKKLFLLKAIASKFRGRRGTAALCASLYGEAPIPERGLELGILLAEGVVPRLGAIRVFGDEELRRLGERDDLPIYLAMGERDVMLRSAASCARLRRLCPAAHIELVAGGGHILFGQIPPGYFRLRPQDGATVA
jgi:pimeloyl-ACP methyl ester carboxylesterase